MEAMYFAVGVLTMVLLAIASLAVYSTVMVLKLKKRTHDEFTELWRCMHENHQFACRAIEDVERLMRSEMRISEQELSNQIGQLNEHIEQLRSYTDHRFDKMIDTYLLVKETEKESKKLIKG